MQIWLHKVRSPKQIILAWEAPISQADRQRWAVGEIRTTTDKRLTFRYFTDAEMREWNNGRSIEGLIAAGFRGYPAFRFDKQELYEGPLVHDAFARRIPPKKRADFEEFKTSFRLSPSLDFDLPTLLSVTGGRQIGDGFSFVDPLESLPETVDLLLEIAGCRHYIESVGDCEIGDQIKFTPEPENKYDPYAIKVLCREKHIGHVNRLQAKAFNAALVTRIYNAQIIRKNGTSDRPRLYCVVQLAHKNKNAA